MNIKERFLKYVSFETSSCEESETVPSTDGQRLFAEYLKNELKSIGLENAELDENGYVYAFLPSNDGTENAIGFISHMDTSPSVSGKNISPESVIYTGGNIKLKRSGEISVLDYPFLQDFVGQELIVTDGTTLLGADDKAGIAEIVTACEYLINHPEIKHKGIAVCITPDEEIGRGADCFDLSKFFAKCAYTVDGGLLGEIEYENFNAASARFAVNGINIHPGDAKNKMKNSVLIALELMNLFPKAETPAHTEKYEGFYHVCGISGDETKTTVNMIIRDHDTVLFEKRKNFAQNAADFINSVYGENTVSVEIKDSYYNMKPKILPHMELIKNAENAMQNVGVTPKIVPIRGGTDGARLSYEGLPCPNLSTGGANFHSVHEFVSIDSMVKMTEVLIELAKM